MGTLSDIVTQSMNNGKQYYNAEQQALDSQAQSMQSRVMKAPQQSQSKQGVTNNPNQGLFSSKTNSAIGNGISGLFSGSGASPAPGSMAAGADVGGGGAGGLGAQASFSDANFQEPGGPAEATLREVPFGSGLVLKNQLTGQLGMVATRPLTREETMRAENHGAGSLDANDPNRQHSQMSDLDLGNLLGRGINPGQSGGDEQLNAGGSLNTMGTLQQFSNDATQYNKNAGSGPGQQQYADGDIEGPYRADLQEPIPQVYAHYDATGQPLEQAQPSQYNPWNPNDAQFSGPVTGLAGNEVNYDEAGRPIPQDVNYAARDLGATTFNGPMIPEQHQLSQEEMQQRRMQDSLATSKSGSQYYPSMQEYGYGKPNVQTSSPAKGTQMQPVEVHVHLHDESVNRDHDEKKPDKSGEYMKSGHFADADIGSAVSAKDLMSQMEQRIDQRVSERLREKSKGRK